MPSIRRYIAGVSIIILLLSACSGPQSIITLEILEPASITYPKDVHSVGYLNRSPKTPSAFSAINLSKLNDTDLFIIDTLITTAIIRGFKEGKSVANLSYLDDIVYLEARRKDTIFRNSVITEQKVNEICTTFGLDALITQDFFSFRFVETFIRNYSTDQLEKLYILLHDIRWTIHIPGRAKPLDVYTLKDTLYYGNQAIEGRAKYLTPLEMLTDGAHVMGYAYGKRNVPAWNEIPRTVFMGRQKELRQAKKYTNKGDWEKAHFIWSQCLSSEDKKLAAKSAHNIAVYYELEDEIEQAISFSRKADELWSIPSIESYKEELELRLLNKQDVLRQLRVNESMGQ